MTLRSARQQRVFWAARMTTTALWRSPSSMPLESPYHAQGGHCIFVSPTTQAGSDIVLLSGNFEIERPVWGTEYMMQDLAEVEVQRHHAL